MENRFSGRDVPGDSKPGPGRRPPIDVDVIADRDMSRIWRTALSQKAHGVPEPALAFTVAVLGDRLRLGFKGEALDLLDLIPPLLLSLSRIGREQKMDLVGLVAARVAGTRSELPDGRPPMVNVRIDGISGPERN